jgi:GNAT superfamily N-acetyltransferase
MRADDLEPAITAIRDGGWGNRRAELSFCVRHAPTTVFVAEQDGGIVGTTIATVSAGIGWLGLGFVAPALRGQHLGTRLTRTALDDLRQRGSRSVLLAATALGRPIYERLGFVVDGHYAIVFGPGLGGHDPDQPGLRGIEPHDLPALSALDRAATGEDRTHLLRALGRGGWSRAMARCAAMPCARRGGLAPPSPRTRRAGGCCSTRCALRLEVASCG